MEAEFKKYTVLDYLTTNNVKVSTAGNAPPNANESHRLPDGQIKCENSREHVFLLCPIQALQSFRRHLLWHRVI